MTEILVFGLSSNYGGIETYLKKIWDHIDHSKFHYSFIDMTGENNRPAFYNELMASGADFYKVTPRNVSWSKNRKEIRAVLKQHHFDILHFNANTLSYIYPVLAAREKNISVLVHSRCSGLELKGLTKLLHYINKIIIQLSNVKRIAVSQIAGEWLFGKSAFDVYFNGVDTQQFVFSEEDRQRIRKEYHAGENYIIGHVGTFLPVKNHRFIVEIFEKVKARIPNAQLWLIGEGPLKSDIEDAVKKKNIEDNVVFFGKQIDVHSLYSAMDSFIFPSQLEGFGNVLLEAQCEGLPCIVSNTIIDEVKLSDDVFSLSLSDSADIWAEKIAEKNILRNADRESAFKKIEEAGFSVGAEIKRLESLYSELKKEYDSDKRCSNTKQN